MKIRIVSYEDLDAWICGKIARRLTDALVRLGYECSVGKTADPTADINHHVIYLNYPGYEKGVHTLMVTHVDDVLKLRRLNEALETATAGICVSSHGVAQLIELGVNPAKLGHVNLAHDGDVLPRRTIIGITTRLYPDGRKREGDISRLIETISPADFSFKIMGFGWRPIVERMQKLGFHVEFHEDFEYRRYLELLASLDYYVYLGHDEGSMGFIDALAAGVKTIVTPQGHHLDAPGGITFPVRNYEDLHASFQEIAKERHKLTGAVAGWTWTHYAQAHVTIWNNCLKGAAVNVGMKAPPPTKRYAAYFRLLIGAFIRKGTMISNLGKEYDCGSRWWSRRRR